MTLYSTPTLQDFVPLPGQLDVIRHLRKKADYEKGTHEVLLSGSVGSAKSLTLAHMAVTHAIMNPGAKMGVGRLALPQLKATLCQKIREHLFNSGIDFKYHHSTGDFQLPNDSKIIATSWADGNYAKLGSTEFSAFVIEELTESRNSRPYDIILQRTNRVPHIKEPFVLSATNPDSPSHWAHKKIIQSKSPLVSTFYSNTFDNPYLPRSYIDQLLERLDDKMAQRMIYGRWVEIDSEVIYYSYSQENFRNVSYEVDKSNPIRVCFDFNIGDGKPLSMALAQYVVSRDEWHIYNEVIVDGARTRDTLDEAAARGLFEGKNLYIIHGDATGSSRDTRSNQSDYDIIEDFFSNYVQKDGERIRFEVQVSRSNPPIRERHNIMNGYMKPSKGPRRFFVYKDAPTADEGFRLTKLRSGGQYLEDDKDRFQHVTTALGYGVVYQNDMKYYDHSVGPTNIGVY
jgi:hypothetical protein